ncbi:hypothetical protein Ddye_014046 [Dipteronia dyeriana]|uniref:MIF4G domain-containing protein n=1 Tax=Dipteronia dyeriana TaxID=168575 RepID=A0AAE0CK55_9ROSI|nr:hypothetical protein Ddye_014046 [Dipteronia dyeriana]
MDELRSANLSKFVSEAVTAICDAKLRSSDIQAAAQAFLCKESASEPEQGQLTVIKEMKTIQKEKGRLKRRNFKDQMNIETKITNIRFIGELCKFKTASSPGLVFTCLKACLDDFTHHNIDVACNLLGTCDRFLYRSPETTVGMANMPEILMRLNNVKNLDPWHATLVKNAYYLCKPPEGSAQVSKVRPPLHQDCEEYC